MTNLKLVLGPALLLGLWIAAASYTSAELATVGPALRLARPEPSPVPGGRPRPEARARRSLR